MDPANRQGVPRPLDGDENTAHRLVRDTNGTRLGTHTEDSPPDVSARRMATNAAPSAKTDRHTQVWEAIPVSR